MNFFRSVRKTPFSFATGFVIALTVWLFLSVGTTTNKPSSFIQSQAYAIGETPPSADLEGWTPYNGILELGFGNKPVWIKLRVAPLPGQNPALPIELEVRPSNIDQINLYDSLRSGTQLNTVGEMFNIANNARPSFGYNFVIPAGSEPRDIWLCIKTNNTRLIDIVALSPREIIYWERTVLTQSNLIIFFFLLFLSWASYNWLIHRDHLLGSFALLQLASLIYGVFELGFSRVYLSDMFGSAPQGWMSNLSIVTLSFLNIWFLKTLISAYPIKPWATYLLRALLSVILLIVTIYFIGQPWVSFMLNDCLNVLAYAALLMISIWGIAWKTQSEHLFLLSKKILIVYFVALLSINLIQVVTVLKPSFINITGVYGSTIYCVLNGLLLTTLLHLRSRHIAQRHQQRVAMEAIRLDNEREQRTLQSQFLDMLAHELKTPLSIISLALSSKSPSDKLKGLASNAVTNMKDVISRCIQATRVSENCFTPNLERIDPSDTLEQLISMNTQSHRIRFSSTYPGLLVADREFLGIAVNNLLDNAIKHGKHHSQINVKLAKENHNQMIEVAIYNEVGQAGVPDPQQVFQKYYRSAGAQRETGSGLGLYLSRMLMQIQKGDIFYEVVDGQVCFKIHLPLYSS